MVNILKQIYGSDNSQDYYIYILSIFIIFFVFIFTIIYLIKINLSEAKLNWETNKCIPKYMFVSGFIKTEEDSTGVLDSTYTNFKKCVKKFGAKHKSKI